MTRRASWTAAGELVDYQAHASGHIYFLYDLGRGTDRHLVKADQLALDLFWHVPDQTRQLIVGQREKKSLPTNIRYHLDHLTVVMDNLGDRIRLGEGSEVRDALHPAAPGALNFYDYRLADSLTLVLPDRQLRVYRVEVRPQDADGPGLVGSLYLDQATADIVRMDFTFTAASYLDETLDYFNIRLENALWEGQYWLPYRQGIELRRGIKAVAFPAGGIIRAEFQISDYRFNTGVPLGFFRGPRVSALSASRLETFEFEAGLYDALDPAVAVTPPSMEEISQQATRIVTQSYLERVQGIRLAIPGLSSVLRFRRAEGLYAGPALSQGVPTAATVSLQVGYASGADRGQAKAWVVGPLAGRYDVEFGGYWRSVADVWAWDASSGMIASLAGLLTGEDYREPYWANGAWVSLGRSWGVARTELSLTYEEWESARLTAGKNVDRSYRAVRELDEGEVTRIAVKLRRPPVVAVESVGGVFWEARLEAASSAVAGDFEYVYTAARAESYWPKLLSGWGVRVAAAAGAVGGGGLPAQRLFPAGGRGSVRGYSFHRFVGNLYAATGVQLSREVYHPFLSVELFSDAGWVGSEGASADRAIDVWNRVGRAAGPTDGALVGVGAGVGILFDILWVELARGLRQGGLWELVVRVRPELWDWL